MTRSQSALTSLELEPIGTNEITAHLARRRSLVESSSMPIQVQCECGKALSVPEKYAGKTIKCPGCAEPLPIPRLTESSPAPPRQPTRVVNSGGNRGPSLVSGGYQIDDFLEHWQPQRGNRPFELASERMLSVNLDGLVWTKKGSMVAYTGKIKFTREALLQRGLMQFFKKALSGEGTALTKAEGTGQLFLADQGKRVSILALDDESITVNGNDVLAFEETIESEVRMMRRVAGMLSGGLFNVHLSGTGLIAITTHFEPMTLIVSEDSPVMTDPNATVAWSESLQPELKTDISFKSLLGRGSGESFQMLFRGEGFVIVQPFEEVYYAAGT